MHGPGLGKGRRVPDWIWDPIERDDDIRRITGRQTGGDSRSGFLKLFSSPDDEHGSWYAIHPEEETGADHVRLRLIQFLWHETSGRKFAEALNLTDTELALTRHLVDGGTARSFAEERGRSVGTARNQLKTLLRKLAIRSQARQTDRVRRRPRFRHR